MQKTRIMRPFVTWTNQELHQAIGIIEGLAPSLYGVSTLQDMKQELTYRESLRVIDGLWEQVANG